MVGVVLVFALFAGRLFQLQLIEGEELLRRRRETRSRTVRLEAPRGEIVDRGGILATTRPAFGSRSCPTTCGIGPHLRRPRAAPRRGPGTSRRHRKATRAGVQARAPGQTTSPRNSCSRRGTPLRAGRGGDRGRAPPPLPRGRPGAHLLGSLGETARTSSSATSSTATVGRRDRAERPRVGVRVEPARIVAGRPQRRSSTWRPRDGLAEEVKPPGRAAASSVVDRLDLPRVAEQAMRTSSSRTEPAPDGAVGRRRAPGDVLAMVVAAPLDPNDFAGGSTAPMEGAHDRRVGAAPEPRDQNHSRRARPSRRSSPPRPPRGVVNEHTTVFCPGLLVRRGRAYRCWRRGGHGTVTSTRRCGARATSSSTGGREARIDGCTRSSRPSASGHTDGHRPRPRGPGR